MGELRITGIGMVTPLGTTADASRRVWADGARADFASVPAWAGTPLAARRVAAPPPFDAASRLDAAGRKMRKFMSPAALLVAVAAREAMAQARPLGRWPPERLGVFSLVGLADTETEDAKALVAASLDADGRVCCRRLGEHGLARANPLLSFRTLPNMPACIVSILEHLGGENALFTTSVADDGLLFRVVEDAFARDVIDGALLCAVDRGASPAVGAHYARLDPVGAPTATAAVALFVERASDRGDPAATWVPRFESADLDARMGRTFAARALLDAALTAPFPAPAPDVSRAPRGSERRAPSADGGRRVAITGLGVVCALGVGRDAVFARLAEGRGGIAPITRFDASTLDARLAGALGDADLRRARAAAEDFLATRPARDVSAARGLPRRAIDALDDEKAIFGLAAAEEALRQAWGAAARIPSGAGAVVFGTSLERFFMERVVADRRVDFPAALAAMLSAADGGWLQYPLDWTAQCVAARLGTDGAVSAVPAYTNISACAAGAQALGQGFHAVRAGHWDWAVCGGFDSMINPLGVGGFARLGALVPPSEDNKDGARACRPFDVDRNGTVLGEGAAVFVLEPLDAARAAGRTVLGELVGYGSSLDAHGLSAPDPAGRGAERAMRAALEDARLAPGDVHAVNAHGTGTRLNDEVEAAAIRRVFPDWRALPVSATKAMTGHLIGAAGSVEMAVCLAAFATNRLVPNIALDRVATGCELHHVTGDAASFDGDVILSNSFGFGGQNAALLVRRARP